MSKQNAGITPSVAFEIQQFVGALAGKGARKGIFITTSKFSEQAKSYLPANVKVVFIDGAQLAEYAILQGEATPTR